MTYKLSKSQKIKDDYMRYKEAVDKIQNNLVKKQYEVILQDFLEQVKMIEEGHSTYNNGYIDPRSNKENIIRLVEVRKKLELLVKN